MLLVKTICLFQALAETGDKAPSCICKFLFSQHCWFLVSFCRYRRIREAQGKPLIFLLLSLAYFWYRKQWWKLTVLSVPLLNMLTVLLGPMALVRYALILFYGAPLYITMDLFAFSFKTDESHTERRTLAFCWDCFWHGGIYWSEMAGSLSAVFSRSHVLGVPGHRSILHACP